MESATILILEDHQPTASALERLLRASHYKTVAVDTIAAARRLAESQQFDLLITDLHLPDGDIFDFLPDLRRGCPRIIAVSGSTLLDSHECTALGFAACLRKPIAFDELQSVMESALQ